MWRRQKEGKKINSLYGTPLYLHEKVKRGQLHSAFRLFRDMGVGSCFPRYNR